MVLDCVLLACLRDVIEQRRVARWKRQIREGHHFHARLGGELAQILIVGVNRVCTFHFPNRNNLIGPATFLDFFASTLVLVAEQIAA